MAPTLPLSIFVIISWVQGGREKEGRRRGEGGEKLNSMRDEGDARREIELIPL